MKLAIKLTLLSILSLTALGLNLKTSSSASAETSAKEDYTKQWKLILTTSTRPPQLCPPPGHATGPKGAPGNKAPGGKDQYVDTATPKSKPNKLAKQQGFGASAYLFDHWDEIFMKDITAEFTKMFEAAQKVKAPDAKVYADPYSPEKMVFLFSQGAAGSAGPPPVGKNSSEALPGNEQENFQRLTKFIKGFNAAVFKNSITAAQLHTIMKDWGWATEQGNNPAKRLLDTYDSDGDGRLNPAELILLSIVHNKKVLKQASCKNFCFTEILTNKIDPLFSFLDCDQDGLVSAENMWAGLSNLKKADPVKYNMYQCQMPTALNKGYRTTSCNDFVLKNHKKTDGFVNLEEFRVGILLGYWDRHVDATKIIIDDAKNLKKLRWGEDGGKDTVCDSILELMPKPNDAKALPPGINKP